MHRLIRRSIEAFLRDTYGDAFWKNVNESAGFDSHRLGVGQPYTDTRSHALLNGAARRLGKPEPELLEDLGAWLARVEPIRRLLRFSGRDFREFLYNLVELPDHAHMVIPELNVPVMEVATDEADGLRVVLPPGRAEWVSAMAGVIRAMADDYGALGLIWVEDNAVRVQIMDGSFTEARDFRLGGVEPCQGHGAE